jgi:uncharacterized protein (UPF0332 family)
MNKEIKALISKSKRAHKAAERLLAEGDYDFAASRAYYAMFYIAEALFLSRSLVTSKHSALLSLFYEHFVKTGEIDKSLHQDLHQAFELRQQGDYWAEPDLSEEMVGDLLKRASNFINVLSNFF